MSNVVVETTVYNKAALGGVLFFADAGRGSLYTDSYQNTRFKNVYVIAGTADDVTTADVDETVVPYMTKWHNTALDASKGEVRNVLAGNDTVESHENNGTTYVSKQYKNVMRYVTLAELFATFNESNPNPLPWNYSNGTLVWKS